VPDLASAIRHLIIITPPILLALAIHEYAHAWVAERLGDPTPRMLGRLTLNPWSHLDPVGTAGLLIPIPPLDGSRVRMEPYGVALLVVLILTGTVGRVIWPMIAMVENLLL
jgi:Zn-dependent protease